jgi:hypothetical protein
MPSGSPGPDIEVCRDETGRLVREALARLDDREQVVVRLRLFEDIPAQAVADMLDTSASHVRVIQTRALAKLRGMLPPPAYLELRDRAGWTVLWAVAAEVGRRNIRGVGAKVRPEAAAEGVGVIGRMASMGSVVAVAVTTAVVVPQALSTGIRSGDEPDIASESTAPTQGQSQTSVDDAPVAVRPPADAPAARTDTATEVTVAPSTTSTQASGNGDPPAATSEPTGPQPPAQETAVDPPDTDVVTVGIDADDGQAGADIELGGLADVEADVAIDDGVTVDVGADLVGTVAADATVEASRDGVGVELDAADAVEMDAELTPEDGVVVDVDVAGVDADVGVDDEGIQIAIGGVSIGLGG